VVLGGAFNEVVGAVDAVGGEVLDPYLALLDLAFVLLQVGPLGLLAWRSTLVAYL
jgi:hypothetical protein